MTKEIEQSKDENLKTLYSGGIAILFLGLLIHSFNENELSYFGSLGLWAIPFGLVFGVLNYLVLFKILMGFGKERFRPDIQKLLEISKIFETKDVILISLLAGFGEELLFRVAIQGTLTDWIGIPIAVVVTALIFALLHAASIYYFAATLVIGFAFGMAYAFADSFLFVAIWHAIYDILAIGLMRFKPKLFE